MKSITEFAQYTLTQGLKAKAALTGEGKSEEEIRQSLSETFKYVDDKLNHFWHALEVAGQHATNLKRVVIASFSEGENVLNLLPPLDQRCGIQNSGKIYRAEHLTHPSVPI